MSIEAVLLETLAGRAGRDGVQQLVVGAVVAHAGKVLLLRRTDDDFMGGIWELPSGKVEQAEPLDAALLREVKEETGRTVASIRNYLGEFDYESGRGRKSRQFNFTVEVLDGEPVTLTEHDAYNWFSLSEQPPVTDAVREVLEAYMTNSLSC